MSKPKFFFEPDTQEDTKSDTFFSTLRDAGVIQDAPEAHKITAEASMQKKGSHLLTIEYGPYRDNYAIHVTPTNPLYNLSSDLSVKRAMYVLATILNEFVPYSIHVNLYLPRPEWTMKVISAVVMNGARTWNFDYPRLESDGIPRIFEAVEKIIHEDPTSQRKHR